MAVAGAGFNPDNFQLVANTAVQPFQSPVNPASREDTRESDPLGMVEEGTAPPGSTELNPEPPRRDEDEAELAAGEEEQVLPVELSVGNKHAGEEDAAPLHLTCDDEGISTQGDEINVLDVTGESDAEAGPSLSMQCEDSSPEHIRSAMESVTRPSGQEVPASITTQPVPSTSQDGNKEERARTTPLKEFSIHVPGMPDSRSGDISTNRRASEPFPTWLVRNRFRGIPSRENFCNESDDVFYLQKIKARIDAHGDPNGDAHNIYCDTAPDTIVMLHDLAFRCASDVGSEPGQAREDAPDEHVPGASTERELLVLLTFEMLSLC